MPQTSQDLQYAIAITLLKGVGPRNAKSLIANCGSPRAVFEESRQNLEQITGIGPGMAQRFNRKEALKRAEEEVKFIGKNKIRAHYYLDETYPRKLKHCEDGPIVLYQKGAADLNQAKTVAMVGTRSATDYGKKFCERFVQDLKIHDPLVVSGLAYGIDAQSHKEAVKNQIPTVAVLAHGLDRLYPPLHKNLSKDMLTGGGALVTEFMSGTKPDRENFPMRNRIIAGLCDATIVVEAAHKGGALITAELANSYNRDVFAVPGRTQDTYSQGCNNLIKSARAHLLTGVKDLEYIMNWQHSNPQKPQQTALFARLNAEEQRLYSLLEKENRSLELELICNRLQRPASKVLPNLMTLELHGLVRSLPGKVYAKN